MKNRVVGLRGLGLSASVLALAVAASPASAQDVMQDVDDAQSAAGADANVIVVSGERAADRNAIADKKKETRIVDVISADDVGKMTDFNAGEAIRRVAGVNTWSYLGEPRFVTIRGFNTSYNTTTVDGFQFASPDNSNYGGGRQFYMDALPSNIASRIEVFKTSTAAMEGHSVGGSINFVVPDALDIRKDRTQLAVRGGYNFNKSAYGKDRPTYQGEAMITRKFGAEKQFGITLMASYWNRKMNIAQYENGGDAYSYGPETNSGGLKVHLDPYSGQYGPYPSKLTWHNYDNSRYRTSLFGKLSWEPADGQRLYVDGYYLEQGEKFSRDSRYLDPAENGSRFDAIKPSAGYVEIDDVASQYEKLQASFTRKIYGGNATYEGTLSDHMKFDVKAGYSEATFTNPQLFTRFAMPAADKEYYSIQQDGEYFIWTPVGATFAAKAADFSNYATNNGGGQSGASGGRVLEENYNTKAKLLQTQMNLAYNMEQNDYGIGVQAGAALSNNKRADGYFRNDYGNSSNGIKMADVFSGNYICAPGCSGNGIAILDPAKIAQVMSTLPVTANASAVGNQFTTEETISAGYLMGRYRTERFELEAGLRYEHTDYFTSGYQSTRTSGYVPVTATSGSDNWLPSAIAIYNVSPSVRLRAAYSRTIGRPSMTQKSLRGGVLNELADPPTLTQGNVNLKPRVSDNYDAIGEWYFDGGEGMITLGLFYKRVQNEIYKSQSLETYDGEQVYLTTPVNSPYTATVKGLEFNFVKRLNFLPGFLSNMGVRANGVFLKTKFPLLLGNGSVVTLDTMPDQATYATNLTVYYEDKGGFSARIGWNHMGKAWDGRIGGNTNLPSADLSTADALYRVQYDTPRDSLDIRVAKDFGNLNVSLSANNLLNQGADTNIGTNQEIPSKRLYVPTAVILGLSYRF